MKILWAIDAFEPSHAVSFGAVDAVLDLSASLGADIQPVYVLSGAEVNLEQDLSAEQVLESYKPAAQAALDNFIHGLGHSDRILPPKVLIQPADSLKKSVELLLSFARRERGTVIALTTHARSTAVQMVMGSFTELMIQHCRVPLLIIGPQGNHHQKSDVSRIENIILPVDFGRYSTTCYLSALAAAKNLGAELHLFHVNRMDSIPPVFGDGLVPILPNLTGIYSEEATLHESQFEEWVKYAEQNGVKARYEVSNKLGEEVCTAILGFARTQTAPLIFLCAERGMLISSLLGGVTRQVLRRSPFPCIVLHSKFIPAVCPLTSPDILKKAA